MNITSQMDDQGRATTGALDHGLLAAKNVDQVRVKSHVLILNIQLHSVEKLKSAVYSHQVTRLGWFSAPSTMIPIQTTSVLLCQGHSQTVPATPTTAHRFIGKQNSTPSLPAEVGGVLFDKTHGSVM